MKTFFKLILWLIICQLPNLAGIQFVYPNLTWYKTLMHPAFTPPDFMFGLVWSVLYLIVGISAFLTFRKELHGYALKLLTVQLALNACWIPVFFGAHSLLGALALIVGMLVEFIFLFLACLKINRTSAMLLIPYGIWLLFATYLTAGTWAIN